MRRVLIALVFSVASCATMNEEDCAYADWRLIGEKDGRVGETLAVFDKRAEQCASFGIAADRAGYDEGRARGLEAYCTPERGFDEGRAGGAYRGVCPPGAEYDFLAEFNIGRRLYELTSSYDSAVSAFDNAVRSIESNRDDLRRARERLRDPNLTDEERAQLERNVDRYRREIDRLEDDLPRLDAAITRADGALEDYRAFLDRRTRRY